ncbi:hypothetical protein JCM6882_002427 [Rhodosporidiobolus microsporus]
MVLPLRYNRVRLCRIDKADLHKLLASPIGQLCQTVSFSRPAHAKCTSRVGDLSHFQLALELLDDLPQLKTVDFSGCGETLNALFQKLDDPKPLPAAVAEAAPAPNAVDDDGVDEDEDDDWDHSSSEDEDPLPNPASLSKIAFTGRRITSWTFDEGHPEIPFAFISLSPSTIATLDIHDFPSPPRPTFSPDSAIDATAFVSRIASLPNLTSFTLRANADEFGNNNAPVLHPAWAAATFLSASTLTSLGIVGMRYNKAVFALIKVFASSLKVLTLDKATRDKEDCPPAWSCRLPVLHTLSLTSKDTLAVGRIYIRFDAPALHTLQVGMRTSPSEDVVPKVFSNFKAKPEPEGGLEAKGAKPLLRKVRILGSSDISDLRRAARWRDSAVATFAEVFTSLPRDPPILVETAWTPMSDWKVKGKNLDETLGAVDSFAEWLKQQAAVVRWSRDETVGHRLWKTASTVGALREYERE